MQTLRSPLLLSSALLAAGAGLTAQGNHSGTTSALPLAFSLEEGISGSADEVWVKPPLSAGAVVAASPAEDPEARAYPLTELLGAYSTIVRFASYSTGCAEIPGRMANGAPDLDSNQNWMLTVVSVSDSTTGDDNSLIDERIKRPSGRTTPGGDLYGFYMSHSVGLSGEVRGKSKLEMHAEGLGLDVDGDIQSVDYGAGVITHALTDLQFVFFANTSDFYFTLDSSCLSEVNASAGGGGFAGGLPADASTIYRLEWQSWSSSWSAPEVYLDAVELGLPASAEIDALVVDPVRDTVVFSVKVGLGLPQLLYYDGSFPRQSVEFADGDGISVTKKLGIKSNDVTDEVDGVDILDPHEGIIGKFYGTAQGLPTVNGMKSARTIGLSMTRSMPDTNVGSQLHFQATGWGSDTPSDGFVFLEMVLPFTYGVDDLLVSNGWRELATIGRRSTQYEVDYSMSVPTNLFTPSIGVKATTLDLSGGSLGASWAVVFQLP